MRVAAAGVNRADTCSARGTTHRPAGESEVPGLEVSGVIEALGEDVDDWAVGDEVCALLAGGGYAEKVRVPAGQVLPVPEGVSLVDAAALPEVVCTVWSNVFLIANLQPGETLLVHGGSSGIGTMAIQLARQVGRRSSSRRGRRPSSRPVVSSAPRCSSTTATKTSSRPSRRRPTVRAPTSSSTSSARSTCPATFLPWPRVGGWSSSGCRAAPAASSTSGRCWPSARPSSRRRCGRGPRRREGHDRGGGARARLAPRRGRAGAADRAVTASAGRRRGGPPRA